MPSRRPLLPTLLTVSASLGVALLAGCGVSAPIAPAHTANLVAGKVHGGQQPVSGATIQLYGVNTTTNGGSATPLLAANSVTTDPGGNFNFLPSAYSCAGVTDVYLTATGGNPGLATANPNLALMAALGPCSALTANTFTSINELSSVAAVNALAPYMTSLSAVGSTPANAPALDAAFARAAQFVDPVTGQT